MTDAPIDRDARGTLCSANDLYIPNAAATKRTGCRALIPLAADMMAIPVGGLPTSAHISPAVTARR